jgi:diguanylate cyclase (GGDEF)-like protein
LGDSPLSAEQEIHDEVQLLRQQKAQLELDIAHLLKHDQLTGLLNRAAFVHEVDAALANPGTPPEQAALIEIGIRGLPRISGSLGRHAGDYAVSALAARLHFSQHGRALTCRLDYWSFAIFIPKIGDPLDALTTAKKLIEILSQPIDWVDRKLTVEVAAGVALSTPEEKDAAALLHNAGLALKTASERGGPGYGFFNPSLAHAARRKTDLLHLVQEATEKQMFELQFQPVYDIKNGVLNGFESLLRLNHPQHGAISPAEFIPVAEESGYITPIGAWTLAEACRVASPWPSHLMVAVNISPEQFYSGTLLTDVHNALELSSFPAYRLEIEITEGTMLKDSEMVLSQLNALREMGCSIVLDDFGTGYSSLSYLWKFPFSKMKIDRSFINALGSSPLVPGMIQSIIDLARNLGLKITAEGIETPEQLLTLRRLGADLVQGYLCGKAAPQQDLAAIIMRNYASQITGLAQGTDTAQVTAAAQ